MLGLSQAAHSRYFFYPPLKIGNLVRQPRSPTPTTVTHCYVNEGAIICLVNGYYILKNL
jgi:hypothetical protein